MTEDELVQAIQAAFPPGVPLAPVDTIAHACEECQEVACTFAGHSWPDVSAEAIDGHFDSLPLLSPAAFREFLPAYMIRGLRQNEDVLEFTTYSLQPAKDEAWWLARVEALTDAQVAVVVEFLDHAAQRSEGYFGEPLSEAMHYWGSRGRPTKS